MCALKTYTPPPGKNVPLYFRTHVGLCLFDVAILMNGVVQGSGVGPVLFFIYIDDLAKLLQRYDITARLFADDVKVYLEITEHEDVVRLQKALDVITAWTSEWQLSVSVSKCNIQGWTRQEWKTRE